MFCEVKVNFLLLTSESSTTRRGSGILVASFLKTANVIDEFGVTLCKAANLFMSVGSGVYVYSIVEMEEIPIQWLYRCVPSTISRLTNSIMTCKGEWDECKPKTNYKMKSSFTEDGLRSCSYTCTDVARDYVLWKDKNEPGLLMKKIGGSMLTLHVLGFETNLVSVEITLGSVLRWTRCRASMMWSRKPRMMNE